MLLLHAPIRWQDFDRSCRPYLKLFETLHRGRFLTTLERHFKNISQGSFGVTLDTLPSMMNAIRMVWVISRHYNTDERMVPLMELIAGEIAGKVQPKLSPSQRERRSILIGLVYS